MSNQLPTTFNAGQQVTVPIDGTEDRRNRRRKMMSINSAEAREMQKHGMRIMKMNIKHLSEIGMDIEKVGIKNVGHGRIAVSGDSAQRAVEEMRDIVYQLRTSTPPSSPEVVIEAMALLKGFNEQVMESGRAHISATKQVDSGSSGSTLTIPFPAGTPMMVAMTPGKQLPVEDKKGEA